MEMGDRAMSPRPDKPGQGPASSQPPDPTPEQVGKYLMHSILGWSIVCLPFIVLLDSISFLLLQVFMFLGTKVIDSALRRMRSSLILSVQTLGQSLRLAIMALLWPFLVKSLNERVAAFEKSQLDENAN